MEKDHGSQFVVLVNNDCEAKSTLDIQFTKLSGQSLIPIDKLTLDISSSSDGSRFLGAVTGNRYCLVYYPNSDPLFVVYEIDESNKKVNMKAQFFIASKINPTAIMAIKDKVFLGFRGQVGYVDLTQPSLSLNLFHSFGNAQYHSKTIDAFAYDSTQPNSELVAIDDIVMPKYAFTYKISKDEPMNSGKFDLPTGPNEHYKDAVKTGNRLILTSAYGHRGGQGNRVRVLEGAKEVWTITEHVPWGNGDEDKDLFVGTEFTGHSSVGLLNGNVILVSAGTRGVIAIPIDQIKKEKKTSYGYQYEVDMPHGIRNIHVGTSAAEVVTVKDKSVAFILGTTTDTNCTVLSQVRWNEQKKDVEVVHSENIEGVYHRLFMEI